MDQDFEEPLIDDGSKRKKKKPKSGEEKKYTHDELTAAVRKFQTDGGLIQKLPDQKSFVSGAIGSTAGRRSTTYTPSPDSTLYSYD